MIKKRWHKWTLFVLLLAGTLFLLEKAFDFGVKHNLNLKSSYAATHKIDAQLLVLGPCEPLWMVSPQILSRKTGLSCYNLASSHSDFADNYLHLRLYLLNNRAPKYLLLYVTPESFDLRYNIFHSYRFAPFLDDPVVAGMVRINDAAYASWRWVPFMRYGYYGHQVGFTALQGMKHYFTGKETPYYPDGFEPPARLTWDNHHENMKKLYPQGYKFIWDEGRENGLEAILRECRDYQIQVIMYESPILQEIADYQLNRGECVQRIAQIARQFHAPYVQFEGLKWAKDRKYFISPMVTTLEGSFMFSDTLGGLLRDKYVK